MRNGVLKQVVLSNSGDHPLSLVLEPWGDTATVEANSSVRVVFDGPDGGDLEIEYSGSTVTVIGWPGSVVSIFVGDEELGRGKWPRGPAPG